MEKIWACSGDSHFMEPPDLFRENLPGGARRSAPALGTRR